MFKTLFASIILLTLGCHNDGSGCDYANDPIVLVTLTERQGKHRLESSIDRDGNVFRGYYEQSFDTYQKSMRFQLPADQAKQIWNAIDKETFSGYYSSVDPKGDFKQIGLTWQGENGTYGVSAAYNELSGDSLLQKALDVIRQHEIDKWTVPQ